MKQILEYFSKQFEMRKIYHQQLKDEIAFDNLKTIRLISFFGLIAYAIICLYSAIRFSNIWSFNINYILFSPSLVIFCLFSNYLIKRDTYDYKLVMILSLLFYIINMGLVINICVFPYPDNLSVIFPLVLVFLGVSLIFTFKLHLLLMVTSELIFLVLSYYYKSPEIFDVICFSVVTSQLFALILSWMVGGIRASDKVTGMRYKLLSTKDALTGIYNKVTVETMISEYIKDINKLPAALVIVDLDNFKEINDLQGHLCGDNVLKKLGDTLLDSFDETSIFGRMGGDEFIILTQYKENIHNFVNNLQSNIKDIDLTCSCGGIIIKEPMSIETAINEADKVLYELKRSGKNDIKII